MADTDDKIATAVEYLAQIPGSVYTPNTLPMGLALASAAELAAVFVAAAAYRKAAANLDAALQRAAEKVLA